MSVRRMVPAVLLVLGLAASSAEAHHGVAAVGAFGPEGPGASLNTTSALPLPQQMVLALFKTEWVPYRQRSFAAPENKRFFLFNTLVLGYGMLPSLTAYVLQPFNIKDQQTLGSNSGLGSTGLMLTFGFKWDEGLRLVPERESLDELFDWHFSIWGSTTLPVGSTEHRGTADELFSPDMQTGFGSPSVGGGLAVLKQLTDDLTWALDLSYQQFFPHEYSFTRYQFGGETRVNTAVTWRIWGAGRTRIDLAPELTGLHLQRDRERNDLGQLEPLTASGGAILYAAGSVRLTHGGLSLALGMQTATLEKLNEASDQQGAEGLETFRASASLSYALQL